MATGSITRTRPSRTFVVALGLLIGCAQRAGDSAPEAMQAQGDLREETGEGDHQLGQLERTVLRPTTSRATHDEHLIHFGVNPTVDTTEENRSSFHLEADTASYALAREALLRNEVPEAGSIRVEEFVNAFDYRYPSPPEGDFALHAEVVPAPHRPGYHLMRLALQTQDLQVQQRTPTHLVFLVDVSSSMDKSGRLDLVKKGLRLLVEQLSVSDRISIVTYGYRAKVVLEPTPGHARGEILTAIDALGPEGATNLDAGLAKAYELLSQDTSDVKTRRLVLCSDGVANTGVTTVATLIDRVEGAASQGLTLSAVGFGVGNYNDSLMEQLARRGRGTYAYVDRLEEARRVFTENLTGVLQLIGTSAKIQVAFEPTAVSRFRLIGYEMSQLGSETFDGDRDGPGEIGAAHSVTALYELELREPDPETLGRVRLRYRTPSGQPRAFERDLPGLLVRDSLDQAEPSTQLAIVAGIFGEKIRGTSWVRAFSWNELSSLHRKMPASLRQQAHVQELGMLIERAAQLVPTRREDLSEAVEFQRLSVLQ